jgi:hypothetical protein
VTGAEKCALLTKIQDNFGFVLISSFEELKVGQRLERLKAEEGFSYDVTCIVLREATREEWDQQLRSLLSIGIPPRDTPHGRRIYAVRAE